MKTKEIPVFLSANDELQEERQVIENVCYRKSKEMIGKYFFNVLEKRSKNPKFQEDVAYYQAIRESELFISLFGREMKKIKKEFKIAYQNYQEKKKPSIYTYLKDEAAWQSEIDTKSLETIKSFEEYLKSLGRSSMSYNNIPDLHREIYKVLSVFMEEHQLQLPEEEVKKVIVNEADKELVAKLKQAEDDIIALKGKMRDLQSTADEQFLTIINFESQVRDYKTEIENLEAQKLDSNAAQIKEFEAKESFGI